MFPPGGPAASDALLCLIVAAVVGAAVCYGCFRSCFINDRAGPGRASVLLPQAAFDWSPDTGLSIKYAQYWRDVRCARSLPAICSLTEKFTNGCDFNGFGRSCIGNCEQRSECSVQTLELRSQVK